MKSIKSLIFAFFTLLFFGTFTSCDPVEEVKSGTWNLVATEIWWVAPPDATSTRVKIASVPFNQTYVFVTPGTTATTDVIYSGAEFNIIRTHKNAGNTLGTINFTWSRFPDYIDPGVQFDCTIESKGTLGNGIGVSNSATTIAGWPGGYGVWTQSFRDGPKTAKLTIAKPADVTVSSKMKFIVELSSGVSFYLSYYYIYEWIP